MKYSHGIEPESKMYKMTNDSKFLYEETLKTDQIAQISTG